MLKVEINKIKLHHTKKKQLEKLNLDVIKLKIARDKLAAKPVKNFDKRMEQLKELSMQITKTKAELKELSDIVDNSKRKIHIFSDKEHVFYPESTNDEDGRTKYDRANPITIKVDKVFTQPDFNVTKLGELKGQALEELRAMRKARKEIGFIEKEYSLKEFPEVKMTYKVYLGGGYGSTGTMIYKDVWRGTAVPMELSYKSNLNFIHMEKGEILKLKEISKLRECFVEKKPTTNDRYIGVEIEFISKGDKYAIAKLLAEKNLQKFVCLANDGSLRKEGDYKHMHELKVCVKETEYHEVIKGVTECINAVGSKVNRRCGLHVHFDMRDRNRDIVYSNLVKAQDVLFDMNPRNRKDGDGDQAYSRPCTTADFSDASGERYMGINVAAYGKHKTFEIRIHSGTINDVKINNWIKLLLSVVNKSKTYASTVSTPELFVERFGLDEEMLKYIQDRVAKFHEKGKHVTVEEAS